MQHGHQLQLAVDFGLATHSKVPDPDGFTEMTEDQLDDTQALAIDIAAKPAVIFLSHSLQRVGFLTGDMLQQHVDLTGSFLRDVA